MLTAEQITKAIAYNANQAGNLWWLTDLPEPLKVAAPTGTAAFANVVADLQAKNGLKVDGLLGPATLAAIMPKAEPVAPKSVTEAALGLISTATAEADKKVRETGKNAGVDVEKYLKCVGMSKGSPWCAAFVSWCVMTAKGLPKPPKWCSGSAVSLYQVAGHSKTCVKTTPSDPDFKSKVKAGWIWSRAQDATAAVAARKGAWCQGHTGIVIAVDSIGWHTIEGNTNAAGSREGDGVYRKTHKWSDVEIVGKTVGWFDPETV